jgi:hypothetical protein
LNSFENFSEERKLFNSLKFCWKINYGSGVGGSFAANFCFTSPIS